MPEVQLVQVVTSPSTEAQAKQPVMTVPQELVQVVPS